jgi:uncharacterized protein (TIGR02646 family)
MDQTEGEYWQMKHVIKQQEPSFLSNLKANDPGITYEKLGRYHSTIKSNLKLALIKEQGYICCYCERRIITNDSHIEHFRPQCDPTVDSLDFTNLLCSCVKDKVAGDPLRCGHSKDNWFDPILLVSPFDPNCETKFRYKPDGLISPAYPNDQAAKETIDRLGLNTTELIALRKGAIEGFSNSDNPFSASELQQAVTDYLQQDLQGRFSPFWTTIKYLHKIGALGV